MLPSLPPEELRKRRYRPDPRLKGKDRKRYPFAHADHGPLTEDDASQAGYDTRVNRRDFLTLAGKLGLGGMATASLYPAFLASCGRTIEEGQGVGFGTAGAGGDTINIGVISIYSGVGAFVGTLAKHGAELAVEQINKHGVDVPPVGADSIFPDFEAYQKNTKGGVLGGKKIHLIQRDDNLSASVAVSALQEMISKFQIKGVIFAGLLDDIYACKRLVQQSNMPAIACYSDIYSTGNLYPQSDYRQVFQIFPPDVWATEVLADYAIEDRGYSKFAFIGDNTNIGNQGKTQVAKALADRGASLAAAEQYNVGDTDMTAQMLRVKGTGCHALFLWGLAGDTARGGGWHPQVVGFPGGAAERTFAELAGPAAKAGTISTWYMGGLGYIPEFQGAVDLFKQRWGAAPTGGENNPSDSVFLLAKAFDTAKTTDPAKVIATLEKTKINFSSATPHEFAPDRHISLTKEDIVGVCLERGKAVDTNPSYELGKEFGEFFPAGYIGPTQFVRLNLESNLKKYPQLEGIFLEQGYGTQCTKVKDPSNQFGFKLTNDCKIH
ncbi:MAG: ABC transporter substrate-binding protein [Actinobacteria bacterium]|nr:ABC transporter substrate-binding protein [Actinomycetota bacterium]